jgi:hypothetical protein
LCDARCTVVISIAAITHYKKQVKCPPSYLHERVRKLDKHKRPLRVRPRAPGVLLGRGVAAAGREAVPEPAPVALEQLDEAQKCPRVRVEHGGRQGHQGGRPVPPVAAVHEHGAWPARRGRQRPGGAGAGWWLCIYKA